jgi:hypothetical protein
MLVDESALRRQVGGVEVMRTQVRHLVAAAERSSVTLRVLPDSLGAHATADVTGLVDVFDDLCSVALSPAESLAFAARLGRQLYGG